MTPEESWRISEHVAPWLAKAVAFAVRKAAEKEREECAKIADEFVAIAEETDGWLGDTGLQKATAKRIARLIRMRSESEGRIE